MRCRSLSHLTAIHDSPIPQSLLRLNKGSLPCYSKAKTIGTLKGYVFMTERQQTTQQPQKKSFFVIH